MTLNKNFLVQIQDHGLPVIGSNGGRGYTCESCVFVLCSDSAAAVGHCWSRTIPKSDSVVHSWFVRRCDSVWRHK